MTYREQEQQLLHEVQQAWEEWRRSPLRSLSPNEREYDGRLFSYTKTYSEDRWALIRLLRVIQLRGFEVLTPRQQQIIDGLMRQQEAA